ncbi:MAG: ribonuclease P protein component [Patescibacteria group bacterium]
MLQKTYRLKKKEIERVFRKSRKYKGSFLNLRLSKNNLPVSRWSFIVPVAVSKYSSQRNFIKRSLREALRKKIKIIRPGFDGIILALPNALGKDHLDIEKEIENLLVISGLK